MFLSYKRRKGGGGHSCEAPEGPIRQILGAASKSWARAVIVGDLYVPCHGRSHCEQHLSCNGGPWEPCRKKNPLERTVSHSDRQRRTFVAEAWKRDRSNSPSPVAFSASWQSSSSPPNRRENGVAPADRLTWSVALRADDSATLRSSLLAHRATAAAIVSSRLYGPPRDPPRGPPREHY